MDVPFTKSHGLGNDFVIVDAIDEPDLASLDWPSIAPRWCDRRTGVGADGVLVLTRDRQERQPAPPPADLRMRIINADGTDAPMCGNGLRCVVKLIVERRGFSGDVLRVRTGRGVLDARFEAATTHGRRVVRTVTVDMGEPILDPARIPLATDVPRVVGVTLDEFERACDPARARGFAALTRELMSADGPDRHDRPGENAAPAVAITCVSMGNPHLVIFVPSVEQRELAEDGQSPARIERLGPVLERHPVFPERINVHLVGATSRTSAVMRTWERGAGMTQACGTGACAVLVAGVLSGVLDRDATIALPGGELRIRWPNEPGAGVLMTGPAVEVFRGSAAVA